MSTRSVAEKLRIKPNATLWSSHPLRLELVKPLPTGVRRVDAPEQATTALVFADDAASLRDLLAAHQERLARPEVLWVAYPKGNRSDINRGHPMADPRRARDAAGHPGVHRPGVVGAALPPAQAGRSTLHRGSELTGGGMPISCRTPSPSSSTLESAHSPSPSRLAGPAGAPNRTRVWGTSSQAAIPPGRWRRRTPELAGQGMAVHQGLGGLRWLAQPYHRSEAQRRARGRIRRSRGTVSTAVMGSPGRAPEGQLSKKPVKKSSVRSRQTRPATRPATVMPSPPG
jgi:hypothetical protein